MSVTPAMLKRSALFSGFTETGLGIFAQVAELERFGAGEVVCHEGDAGDALCLVLRGVLEVGEAGEAQCVLSAGAHFGELALARPTVRALTVRAREPSELAVITREAFVALAPQKPQACLKLTLAILGVMDDRLRELRGAA